MRLRPLAVAVSGVLLVVTLSACTNSTPPRDTSDTPAASAPPASAAPGQTSEPAAGSGDPACDTIITPGTVEALTDIGWTSGRQDFIIGDASFPDGMLCFWADYTVASDHGQLYGWAALSAAEAATAQMSLSDAGWIREDGPEGAYFTEDPQFAMSVDDEGYGMTYLFGDGWVKLSDTKQGLILIDWKE